MKSIFIVTHGEKFGDANPMMTVKGFMSIARLRKLLPEKPAIVVAGTGNRHREVARALGLKEIQRWTGVLGDADSLVVVEGEQMVQFPNDYKVPLEECTTATDMAPATKALVASLPDKAVCCAGRPAMIALGVTDAKSAAVYCVSVADDGGNILAITEVQESAGPSLIALP